jgi:hypothetical protein
MSKQDVTETWADEDDDGNDNPFIIIIMRRTAGRSHVVRAGDGGEWTLLAVDVFIDGVKLLF